MLRLTGLTGVFLLISLTVSGQKFTGIALTPPMGWNSWNYFGCDINEEIVKQIARAMVESGMKDAGYEYVVIDDCWQIARDESGRIIPDPDRFPSGIKALADYVHSLGLKFGLYSDAGRKTCQERPGSYGYEEIDAMTYAEWGVDYLKYDWCHTCGIRQQVAYPKMRDALYKAGRPVVFSICEWGRSKPWTWAQDVGHLWRTTGDIRDKWRNHGIFFVGIMNILDRQVGLEAYAGPDHWNDPDMLQVGNGGMTFDEYKAHFSLWCMLAAPLMAGNDLRNMDEQTRYILTNKKAIAVNQDPLGKQGYKAIDDGKFEVWVKPLSANAMAVCFLNRKRKPMQLDFDWSRLNLKGVYAIEDLWDDGISGTTGHHLKATLNGHSVFLVKLNPLTQH